MSNHINSCHSRNFLNMSGLVQRELICFYKHVQTCHKVMIWFFMSQTCLNLSKCKRWRNTLKLSKWYMKCFCTDDKAIPWITSTVRYIVFKKGNVHSHLTSVFKRQFLDRIIICYFKISWISLGTRRVISHKRLYKKFGVWLIKPNRTIGNIISGVWF